MSPLQTSPLPRVFHKAPFKRRSRWPLLWAVVIGGILCALIIFAGVRLWGRPLDIRLPGQKNPLFAWHGSPGQKVLLIMGVDAPNVTVRKDTPDAFEGTRTDTMMLARINSAKKQISIVSIPRDSKVYLAGNRGVDKINAAHAIGGPELAVQTVQDSFGIPIDNFVVINFRGVRELVDALGGIDVLVEKPMHYTDNTAKLRIRLEPGMQHLNGEQAEGFLRFRHDAMGDIGRIRRQQQFVTAVGKKLREPAVILRIPALVKLSGQYLETDLSPRDLLTLAFFGKDIQPGSIRAATLPGHPAGSRVSYWVIDSQPAERVLNRLILDNPVSEETSAGASGPIRVGIYYDPSLENELPGFVQNLEQRHFSISCKSPQRYGGASQIIEHSSRVTDELSDVLRRADARLADARLIFMPVGATFENNACSTNEDYTLILGSGLRH